MIHISRGNSKLGSIASISLPPGISCPPGVPCHQLCYARTHAYWRTSVKAAWDENLAEYTAASWKYFDQLYSFLKRKNPVRFRFHVSGDIIDERYFANMMLLASVFPGTSFMAYTKTSFGPSTEANFALLRSTWPGWYYTDGKDMPIAVFVPKTTVDIGVPGKFFCPGSCRSCRRCWDSKPGDVILFHQH